ncbi:MAG TPA: membrane protein insertion efficiency factor YidD [Candidatus Nitrosocosmicus sp.]|nr:membrane protein insertion efficiency factor YidD [Candidatus Nitrosocosmicus sp.]
MKLLLLALIRGYRMLLSPLLPRACRFHPSCSEYAEEAFRTLPLHRALFRSTRRVLKCHPFHPGGYDPVHH